MKKIIITCNNCKQKMKITTKLAKYKCPNCQTIYKFTWYKKFFYYFTSFFKGMFQTCVDIKNNIIRNFKNAKASYKYMSQMKKNMKSNPNWSNYYNEKAEEKKMKQAQKPKFWDRFRK